MFNFQNFKQIFYIIFFLVLTKKKDGDGLKEVKKYKIKKDSEYINN